MAQDSDDLLFVVNIVVWVLVVILAIVALHCPLPHRVIKCYQPPMTDIVSLLSLLLLGDASLTVRPGATGLLIRMEYSRVRSSTRLCPTSFVSTRIGVELVDGLGN